MSDAGARRQVAVAGPFVKMAHDRGEYGNMQAYGNDLADIRGHVADSGEGRRTIMHGIDLEAWDARFHSRHGGDHDTRRVPAALRNQLGGPAVQREGAV